MKSRLMGMALLSVLSAPTFGAETYFALDYGKVTLSNAVSPYDSTLNFPNPGNFNFALGLQISPALAIEAGYTIFGESKINWGSAGYETLTGNSFNVSALGSQPINDNITVFGRLGFTKNSGEYKDIYTTTPSWNTTASYSSTGLLYGLGAAYKINEHYSIRGQYSNYGDFGDPAPSVGLTTLSIGLVYGF